MNRLQQVRTAEHSALSFPMRPLGHQQMATDTALGITERVIVDRGWFFLSLLYLDPNSKSPKPSPRASARSSLPSEALEEFLSILRPSLFSPRSPILHPLRYPISSLHDCALALPSKPVSGIDNLSVLPHDDSRTPVNQLGVPLNSRAPPLRENDENDVGPEMPLRVLPFRRLRLRPRAPLSTENIKNLCPKHLHDSGENVATPVPDRAKLTGRPQK